MSCGIGVDGVAEAMHGARRRETMEGLHSNARNTAFHETTAYNSRCECDFLLLWDFDVFVCSLPFCISAF